VSRVLLFTGPLGLLAAGLLAAGCGGKKRVKEAEEPLPVVAFPSPTAEPPAPEPEEAITGTFELYRPRDPRPTSELEQAAAPAAPFPPVAGKVKSVGRGREYVTIDRGSDDGVREGDTFLIVHRTFASPEGSIPVEYRMREMPVSRAIVVKVKPRECIARLLGDEDGEPVHAGDVAVAQSY